MSFKTNIPHWNLSEDDKILYPFGPPIFQTEVSNTFCDELITEGRKLNKEEDDWNPRLAGNLKYGRSFIYKRDYTDKVEPFIKGKVEKFFNGLYEQYGKETKMIDNIMTRAVDKRTFKNGKMMLDTLWINFSKKHDYNPPHNHTGVLSFVIFCQVPEKIFSVQADSNAQRAGYLHFSYGQQISDLMGCEYPIKPYKSLMLIFPAKLEHFVPPYWVDADRISVSGNLIVV